MLLKEVMTTELEPIEPDDKLFEAASRMKRRDVGLLPVLEDGRIVGVITDRDITVRAVAEGHDPVLMTVGEAMSRDVVCGDPEDDVEDAARMMKERGVRRIIVVDAEQHPVGIVSLGDLARRTPDARHAGATLATVAEQQQEHQSETETRGRESSRDSRR